MDSEYRIERLEDFLKVPADRQAACLADFALWLDLARDSQPTNDALCEALGLPGPGTLTMKLDIFRWIDDGTTGINGCRIYAGESHVDLKFVKENENGQEA